MNEREVSPPRLARHMLKALFPDDGSYSILGDFEEEFHEKVESHGIFFARSWYWMQLLIALPHCIWNSLTWGLYFVFINMRFAVRSMIKRPGFSFVNIAGLSFGIACSLIIALYVFNELSYDKYHKDYERIYRIVTSKKINETEFRGAASPAPLASHLLKDYPQVEAATCLVPPFENASNVLARIGDKRFFEDRVWIVDTSIFDVFTINMIRGNPITALEEPAKVIISRSTAQKYFGEENPMGKHIELEINYDYHYPVQMEEFEITGVMEDVPENTHIKYDIFVSMPTLTSKLDWFYENWYPHPMKLTYIKLRENTNIKEFEDSIQRLGILAGEVNSSIYGRKMDPFVFLLQPISSIHMQTSYKVINAHHTEEYGNWYYLYVYSIIALLILIIGCMNYMNLSAMVSSVRTREVGVRKVIGAYKRQLVAQFLSESFLVTVTAFVVALMLISVMLPLFNRFAGTALSYVDLEKPEVILPVAGLLFLLILGAGSYPAFVLTNFKPVSVLRGKLSIGSRGAWAQKILVIGQFSISIMLVICTITVFRQLEYMKSSALGFDREQKLILRVKSNLSYLRRNMDAVKLEFTSHPDINGATITSTVPGEDTDGGYYLFPDGSRDNPDVRLKVYTVDYDFIDLYKINVIAGRKFDRNYGNDQENSFIVNEAGMRQLGYQKPEDLIGKEFLAHYNGKTKTVVGVIKDFHFRGMQESVEPLLLDIETSLMRTITLSVNAENIHSTIKFVNEKWEELFPGIPMEYSFLDDEFDREYQYEERMGKMLTVVTSLALSIAFLGLLGMASFIVRQREKEIGIRKVLGASVSDIIKLLSGQFIALVLIASLIAAPLGWWAMHRWLADFAYKIDLGWLVFLVAGAAALIITLLTVSFQGTRAAIINPSETLRRE